MTLKWVVGALCCYTSHFLVLLLSYQAKPAFHLSESSLLEQSQKTASHQLFTFYLKVRYRNLQLIWRFCFVFILGIFAIQRGCHVAKIHLLALQRGKKWKPWVQTCIFKTRTLKSPLKSSCIWLTMETDCDACSFSGSCHHLSNRPVGQFTIYLALNSFAFFLLIFFSINEEKTASYGSSLNMTVAANSIQFKNSLLIPTGKFSSKISA